MKGAGYLRALESAARVADLQLIAAHVHDAADIKRAISTMARQSNGSLIMTRAGC
jgi:hypothetical protein